MTPTDLIHSLAPITGQDAAGTYARIIMRWLKGWNAVDMAVHLSDEFSPFIVSEIEKIIARLKAHEPIQYIVGEEYFCGRYFKVEPGVLIPRPETQELVDLIVSRYKEQSDLRVLDLCCGTGCIAVSLALSLPFARVTALDISAKAVALTAENARRLKGKVAVMEDDIFSFTPATESLDIIVSNPPYIPLEEKVDMDPEVVNYEPHEALFVPNDDPLIFYRRLSVVAALGLAPSGTLWAEINPRFCAEISSMLKGAGLTDVDIIRDSYGRMRFAYARKPSDHEN